MEAPNCLARGRFSMPSDGRFRYRILGCRHGLVLVCDQKLKQVRVWDPIAGDQHCLAVPPGLNKYGILIVGAVLRPAGDHFQVVLAGSNKQEQHIRAFACICSSETGVWSDLVSPPLPSADYTSSIPSMYFASMPAVLAGDSLYWVLIGISNVILKFDLDKKMLGVIYLPVEFALCKSSDFMVLPAEGGGLSLLFISDLTAQVWKMNTGCDGVASLVLGRTIELGKLLSLNTKLERKFLTIIGFAEYNNVVFLSTAVGVVMLQLDSLQFKNLSRPNIVSSYHPFETVYAAGI